MLLFYDLLKQSNKEIISETSMEWFHIKPRCEKQGSRILVQIKIMWEVTNIRLPIPLLFNNITMPSSIAHLGFHFCFFCRVAALSLVLSPYGGFELYMRYYDISKSCFVVKSIILNI